jgi:hypothetical protein
MSGNGANDWDVAYSRITFLERVLSSHPNIASFSRHDDIVFEIHRRQQGDRLTVVCVDPYTASLEFVMRVVTEFPSVNIIYVGGKWAGYTQDAYDFCQQRKIGIYNAGELAGGLQKDAFWRYEKFDSDGNSTKSVRAR